MASFIDKVVGVYHFVSDRVPKNVPFVDPKPRIVNPAGLYNLSKKPGLAGFIFKIILGVLALYAFVPMDCSCWLGLIHVLIRRGRCFLYGAITTFAEFISTNTHCSIPTRAWLYVRTDGASPSCHNILTRSHIVSIGIAN